MLPENITAIMARNETWTQEAASEPYEAGWAREAVIFVRALKEPTGVQPVAEVQISPDGIHWLAEGTTIKMPRSQNELCAARVHHFGNWLRLYAVFEEGSCSTVLVTIHAKA